MMEELVKITKNEKGINVVSARELHVFLESKQDFSNWVKNRIEKYGFIEGLDYEIVIINPDKKSLNNFIELSGSPSSSGWNRIEYALTLDTAKEISMVEGNDKGRQVRRYFIACEEKLREIVGKVPNEALVNLETAKINYEATKLLHNERKAQILLEIADTYKVESYKEIIKAYAVEALTGKLLLPEVTEKTYSATEIGDQLGLSANKVGRIANSLGLKAPEGEKGEYGEWFVDKARYSSKEVETFRYNQKGFDKIKECIEVTVEGD